MTPKERREFLMRIPWVTWREKAVRCESYRWSHMPLNVAFGGPLGGIHEYRCKNSAHWRFVALRRRKYQPSGTTGIYCMSHLICQLRSGREEDRLQEWRTNQKIMGV